MRLGFIGIGNLGSPLAASLVRAGFAVTVHDLDKDLAAPLIRAGAAWAESPKAVAERSDSVFTCLPSPEAVAAVVSGPNGIIAGLARGGTWIDMSTNDRHELQRLAALAAERGIACLEAPVTGGVHKAASGEITVLVGGDDAVFAAHRPALEAMGGQVFHMGPLGSASIIKVITNMLAFIHLVAAGEALMLAKRGDECAKVLGLESHYGNVVRIALGVLLPLGFNFVIVGNLVEHRHPALHVRRRRGCHFGVLGMD